MEKNISDKHFSNSIFIIPVDDNYSFKKHSLPSTSKPPSTQLLTTKLIFVDNPIPRIHSYLTYYKAHYASQLQSQFISVDNTQHAHRRYATSFK
jgi:hypothetical protein